MKSTRKKLKESTVGNLVVFAGLVLIVVSFALPLLVGPVGVQVTILGLALVVIGSTTNLLKFLQGIYLILPEEKRDDNH
jgi:hypothetical protein